MPGQGGIDPMPDYDRDDTDSDSDSDTTAEDSHISWPLVRESGRSDEYDDDAVAIFEDLPLQDYDITVEHPDYLTSTRENLTLDESGRQPIVELEPDFRERFAVDVTVTDSSTGLGIRDARVEIGPETGRTDRDGDVTLDVPEGTHDVVITAEGYLSRTDSISIFGATTESYELDPSAFSTTYLYGREATPLRSWGVGYWPFDAEADYADVISIGDTTYNGVNNGTTGTDGLQGTDAIDFGGPDEENYVSVEGMPLHDPAAPWTLICWANVRSSGSFQCFIALEDPTSGEYVGIGRNNNDELRVFSDGRTSLAGSVAPTGEWIMATLVWTGSEFRAYLNGDLNYTIAPSGSNDAENWLRPVSRLTFGTRRLAESGELDGSLDEILLFDQQLSQSQIQAVYEFADHNNTSGFVDPGRTDAPADLVTDADIPAGCSIRVRVQEDVGDTGTIDNSDSFDIADGIRRYRLSEFDGSEGNRYYLRVRKSPADDLSATPLLRSKTVESATAADQVGSVFFRLPNGVVVQAPAFDPGSLSESWVRVRRSTADPAQCLEAVPNPDTSMPLRCRHPTTGTIYGIRLEDA